jgi:hypothetical protein
MAKIKKGPDVSYVCYVSDADDYVFMPTLSLHPNWVVGVNSNNAVLCYDSPAQRKASELRMRKDAFNARLDSGEHLHPQQDPYTRRSFEIDDYARFGFGRVEFVRIPRELPPGVIPVYHNYDPFANFHPDDGVEIQMRGGISQRRLKSSPLELIL